MAEETTAKKERQRSASCYEYSIPLNPRHLLLVRALEQDQDQALEQALVLAQARELALAQVSVQVLDQDQASKLRPARSMVRSQTLDHLSGAILPHAN